MKKKVLTLTTIAFLVFAMFASSVLVNKTVAESPEEDDVGNTGPPSGSFDNITNYEITIPSGSYTTIQYVDQPIPPFDEYRWYNQDFGWQHTFDPTNKQIISVTLDIRAWDVDSGPGPEREHNVVYAEGNYAGELVGLNAQWSNSTFTIDPALLTDGLLNIWLDIDSTHNELFWATTIDWSRLTVVWDWNQYYLTVHTAPAFLPTIPGEGWYDRCTYVDLEAPEYVHTVTDTRYRFDYWDIDSVNITGNPITVHMDANHTATAHYIKQYHLTVVSPYDTPSGDGWYDECTYVYATLTYGIENIASKVRAVFTGWSGDASGTGLVSDPIHVDGPKTAIALWKIQYYLDVVTDPSTLPPIPGADWYDNCTWVGLTAPAYVPNETGISGVRYRFDYWDVDIISQGSGVNPILVHMNASHVATAHFVVQYYLTVTTDPAGLDPAPVGEGWYDESTTVSLIAPPTSYLDDVPYVFAYWDVDGSATSDDAIQVHMNMSHVATAHYWLPGPRHLDAEPPLLIDLASPISTQWQELYPEYSRNYILESWYDTNQDGRLTPSDFIDLWDMDRQWKVTPHFWHINDITVTLRLKRVNSTEIIYVEFEGGWAGYDRVIFQPVCTLWYEVYPNYSNEYYLEKWFDNCNSRLSYCDNIILYNLNTSERALYHVEAAKTDLIISPRATSVTLGKAKEVIGEGHPQVIPVFIDNYYSNTTDFTAAAYYDGAQPVGNATITLDPLESGDAIVVWADVATWPKGTYSFNITVIVYADGLPIYATTFPMTFKITIVGDINGDGKIDIKDVSAAAHAFGTYIHHPRWKPDCDINEDGKIDIKDIGLIAKRFGTIDP